MGGHEDDQWENTRAYYEGIKKDCELAHMTDMEEYTAALQDGRYSIFISSKDEYTANLSDSVIRNLKDLGLELPLQGAAGTGYLAVVSNGNVMERAGSVELEAEGTVRGGRVMYEMAGGVNGNASSVKVNGGEYSKNGRGLNFVVYNHVTRRIIDSVCFDTYTPGSPAVR